MIPDGTSLATVSAARWYQWYLNPEKPNLHLDPYLCGSVLTFSSNAPIGDSAPTTSCFMTGVPSRAGYVSTYPLADAENDILPLDPNMAYQPLMTVLEASKLKNMSTGLVFTCEFPHATPADCASHTYNRGKYEWISPQMVHNNIDIVIGGGTKHLSKEQQEYLLKKGYGVYLDDISGFRSHTGNKMWSLFCENDMPYDLDKDNNVHPSLSEMTAKAIEKLSKNENGFFLMVEGSKIDWAAHANDPIGMITDMLAFDKAFGVALDFAKKNGETVVIAVPDHGNSGISIGSSNCPDYGSLTKDQLFKNITGYKATTETIIKIMRDTEPAKVNEVFKELSGLNLSDEDVKRIVSSRDYNKSELSAEEKAKGRSVSTAVKDIISKNHCFGFTTGGHTGEEVFLAVYSPENVQRPTGHIRNVDVNQYIQNILSIDNLKNYTADYFAKHTTVFRNGKCTINKSETNPVLEVEMNNKKLSVKAYSNIVVLNGKEIELSTVVVYIDKTDTFYLPKHLIRLLES